MNLLIEVEKDHMTEMIEDLMAHLKRRDLIDIQDPDLKAETSIKRLSQKPPRCKISKTLKHKTETLNLKKQSKKPKSDLKYHQLYFLSTI